MMSARLSRDLIARLRRNEAALLMASGRLPEGRTWVEPVEYDGIRPLDSPRWRIAGESGWSNIVSRWPVSLIVNAPDLYFRPDPDLKDCYVEITP